MANTTPIPPRNRREIVQPRDVTPQAPFVDPRPWWKRVLSKLFVNQYPRLGAPPEWAKKRLTSFVEVKLGWRDRLRVLLCGRISTQVVAYMQRDAGQVKSGSVTIVRRPEFLDHKK